MAHNSDSDNSDYDNSDSDGGDDEPFEITIKPHVEEKIIELEEKLKMLGFYEYRKKHFFCNKIENQNITLGTSPENYSSWRAQANSILSSF